MIIDVLENADFYTSLNPHLATAFAFLRRPNLADLPEGKHEVDGVNVWAVVAKGIGRKPGEALIETHDDYLDVQFVLKGVDNIGWKARKDLGPVVEARPATDVAFYADTPSSWSQVGPGSFGIYFPNDGHLPMISDEWLHKVIMKVAVK
ncbi:YhcH/YjgK/YiaL family protein [Pseudodesulfovibrio sp. zrk46]|uniref:YhcH/YjgK/YiaL family protein n=1 Tax=Pseudodesulfovibrio sp. zrk46 TaxID=2725288 RepID=UPI0014497D0B|nr:YhcH/YjgK/YiaL family protein [Pseudodesulfovibrio sp. zrk46]QJB57334.1 DUF386 domain-containing protein [Pseudodesulfovibrio sp. zrk46]